MRAANLLIVRELTFSWQPAADPIAGAIAADSVASAAAPEVVARPAEVARRLDAAVTHLRRADGPLRESSKRDVRNQTAFARSTRRAMRSGQLDANVLVSACRW